jgi:hypothetical protein
MQCNKLRILFSIKRFASASAIYIRTTYHLGHKSTIPISKMACALEHAVAHVCDALYAECLPLVLQRQQLQQRRAHLLDVSGKKFEELVANSTNCRS